MADIVNRQTRSRMMSGIRNKNTGIEVSARKALFHRGYRYRLNDSKLAGKPDLVLPKYRTVVFINGCFWHGHGCSLFRLPASNTGFWKDKIQKNRDRDRKNIDTLTGQGWRVAIIWECAIRGKGDEALKSMADKFELWIRNTELYLEISA